MKRVLMMVRNGGGHSSLGYLFAGPEDPKPFVALNYYYCLDPSSGGRKYDQPSTKVHVAAGGGSSLGFLFDGSGISN
ncbi:hypothetical protein MKW94_021131 [Papaver nudicaule]|uniref:Uncharacterized protein n=1 Tax=Papaver nudicaule TaxID=74823 RepID=A0AA41RL91_PAPNU|nr:hypothetical protein [Papaver nudicaule]